MFKKPVAESSVDLSAITDALGNLAEAVDAIPTVDVSTDVGTIQEDIATIKGDIADIKGDIATILINTTPTP